MKSFADTLAAINAMKTEGVIEEYVPHRPLPEAGGEDAQATRVRSRAWTAHVEPRAAR